MNNNRQFQKSSLYAFNTTAQTIPTNGLVAFANPATTGCSVDLATANNVRLKCSGLYKVDFSASVTTSGTAGNVTFQLYRNGTPVAGAIASANSATTTDLKSISFPVLIRVNPNCCGNPDNIPVNLTVVNIGTGAIVTNAIITVVKEA